MTNYLAIRDGGKTNEEGAMRIFGQRITTFGVFGSGDLAVGQRAAGANMSVDVATGDLVLSHLEYACHVWSTAINNIVITGNTSGNPRIDAIIGWVDLTVVDPTSSNNPGALKFSAIAGTPAVSPAAPLDATIQSAIGAGNPFHRLANVAVANAAASIVTANITSTRTELLFTGESTTRFYAADSVGTDAYAITISPAPTAYAAGQMFNVKVGTANTGVATLNVNSLGAVTIKKNKDQDLQTGDIESGQIITVVYDGTNFQLQSALAQVFAADGWIGANETWTRTGNHTFTISGDVTTKYQKGTKIKYKDGGSFEYGVVSTAVYGAPNTTITLVTNTSYEMAAVTITENYLSHAAQPFGWPEWFVYTLTNTGFSSSTTSARFAIQGGTCHVKIDISGTSNLTTFLTNAPVANNSGGTIFIGGYRAQDNGATITLTVPACVFTSASTTIEFYKDWNATAWTNSGTKAAQVNFSYQW